MFTGIIHNLGSVSYVQKRNRAYRLSFRFKRKEKNVTEGESIAVNGVCLTSLEVSPSGFSADLLPETLEVTNLGRLKVGDSVNVERSLKVGDAIGGHFISGHVDAFGRIERIERRGTNWSLLVGCPKNIIRRLVLKGSVACDGVSLTVQEILSKSFRVSIIPHTLKATTLGFRHTGDLINLEIDMPVRYQKNIDCPQTQSKLTVAKLKKQGF